MKILITGATGFIGSHLLKRLKKLDFEIHIILRDKSTFSKFKNIFYYIDDGLMDNLIDYFRKEKFDGVIHLASRFVIDHEPNDLADLINSNLLFSTRILEASIKTRVKWFINTGSFWQHYKNNNYSPVNLYAATKQAFSAISQFYIERYAIKFITLELSDTYGPNDLRNKFINKWLNISKTGEAIDMSKGEQLVDLVYIDDVIDAYLALIKLLETNDKRIKAGDFFAVTSDRYHSLKELASIFERVSGLKLNVNWGALPYRNREVMIPNNCGKNLPGWNQKISFEKGIKKLLRKK